MTRVSMRFSFLAFGLLLFFIAGTRTQEIDDEKEFTYDNGPLGPENWGNLKQEWKLCGEGKKQSPINIDDSWAQFDPNLEMVRHYRSGEARLVNRGHDIMLSWPAGAGSIQIDGKDYALKQSHWHHPSEHKLNGIPYPLEMHLVHQSHDGEIAVVGVLYDFGEAPEPLLVKLTEQLQYLASKNVSEVDGGVVDAMEIDMHSNEYYRYDGSLTTPPCTEGVVWTVVGEVKSVLPEQVELLRDAVHDGFGMNARPLQPLNGRTVNKFDFFHIMMDSSGLVDVN